MIPRRFLFENEDTSIKNWGLISDDMAAKCNLSEQEAVKINRDRRFIVLEGGRVLLDQPRKIC